MASYDQFTESLRRLRYADKGMVLLVDSTALVEVGALGMATGGIGG